VKNRFRLWVFRSSERSLFFGVIVRIKL